MADQKFDDLDRKWRLGEDQDIALRAEQRSNCLLVIGDHYSKKTGAYWNRLRDTKQISEAQRLRVTRNHIHRVCHKYKDGIIRFAPNVTVTPAVESDLQSQKAAELHKSVLRFVQKDIGFSKRRKEAVKDFVEMGEVVWKIYWDENAGVPMKNPEFLAAQQQQQQQGAGMAELMGGAGGQEPEGEPLQLPPETIMTGAVIVERVFSFNLIRPEGAESMDKAPWLGVQKMVPLPELKKMAGPDEEKRKLIQESSKGTYTVYDGQEGNYRSNKDQGRLREMYFRPCIDYPNGYYYFMVDNGIIAEGELPGGIFPIIYAGFDDIPTTPRARSIIKQIRPVQVDINRMASKQAEHQMTVGDDKLWFRSGTKISPGMTMPGVRTGFHTGEPPTVVQGRAGEQFTAPIDAAVKELYTIANIPDEIDDELPPQTNDPFIAIHLKLAKKKKYAGYGEKIIDFFVEAHTVMLKTAKHHIRDEALIPMIGKCERVNIPEFRSAEDLLHQVTVEESSDDPESLAAKQAVINHAIQYASGKLDRNDIGRLIRCSPFLNQEELFQDLTLDYDAAKNDILAMDRGEQWPVEKYDDHDYMLKALIARTKKPDYKFLSQQIRNNYDMKIQAHEKFKADAINEQMRVEKGLIPTTGYAVKCDFYVSDPQNPMKSHRLELPSDSVGWLVSTLNSQGNLLNPVKNLPIGAQAEIAGQVPNQPTQTPIQDLGAVKGSGPESPGGING